MFASTPAARVSPAASRTAWILNLLSSAFAGGLPGSAGADPKPCAAHSAPFACSPTTVSAPATPAFGGSRP